MTSPQRLLRLNTTAPSLLDNRTGARGEVFYDNTDQTLRIFDGQLLGGRALLRADLSNLEGTITTDKITNATLTLGQTVVLLGGGTDKLQGFTEVASTDFVGDLTGAVTGNVTGDLTGNADTATTLETARNINYVLFDGSSDIIINGLYHQTGGVLDGGINVDAGSVLNFSNLSFINPTSGNNSNDLVITTTGAVHPNGAGRIKVTVTAPVSTVNNTGLVQVDKGSVFLSAYVENGAAATVDIAPTGITVTGTAQFNSTITGSVSGNAGTVTNGVYTNGTYANPSWITSLALSKVGLTVGKSLDYNATSTPALNVKATAATVDFGTTPVTSKSFTITDANSTVSNSAMIYPVGDDEWEMDPIAYSARCNAGTITVYASTSQGPVKGTRNIRYVLV